ncbi:hypothetical protein BP354E_5365 [Burkholderia pseudomallei 354e]|nr:hypothetical protein BP354E_5365 [Burkholderia pseudomallei 354e]EIF74253.1 hypothetical protein BP354A_5423 [Burkholderia pseudomallei 354a]
MSSTHTPHALNRGDSGVTDLICSTPGDRYARLQAKLDQLPHGIFIKFPPAIPSAANHQSASKVLFLCHHGLSACVHADT